MANLERRGAYTPRRVREQRAYRLLVTGSTAAVVGVVGVILDVAGVLGAGLPIVAFVIAAICIVLFRQLTRPR